MQENKVSTIECAVDKFKQLSTYHRLLGQLPKHQIVGPMQLLVPEISLTFVPPHLLPFSRRL